MNKMAISKFLSDDFGKKWRGRWPSSPPFFWSLKKDIRTFNFRLNEHSSDILGLPGWYDHPWEKKIINKHTSMIFLLEKIRNSTYLQIRAWNLYSRVLWYAEFDGVIFIDMIRLLVVFTPFPFFCKSGKFSQAHNLCWIRLNTMKSIYLKSA